MRNSELMRRRANVSTLDLGRIKSDLGAIGEISQEEKDGHSFFDCMDHFVCVPPPPTPSSKMTYLLVHNQCRMTVSTYPHICSI